MFLLKIKTLCLRIVCSAALDEEGETCERAGRSRCHVDDGEKTQPIQPAQGVPSLPLLLSYLDIALYLPILQKIEKKKSDEKAKLTKRKAQGIYMYVYVYVCICMCTHTQSLPKNNRIPVSIFHFSI